MSSLAASGRSFGTEGIDEGKKKTVRVAVGTVKNEDIHDVQ